MLAYLKVLNLQAIDHAGRSRKGEEEGGTSTGDAGNASKSRLRGHILLAWLAGFVEGFSRDSYCPRSKHVCDYAKKENLALYLLGLRGKKGKGYLKEAMKAKYLKTSADSISTLPKNWTPGPEVRVPMADMLRSPPHKRPASEPLPVADKRRKKAKRAE